MEGSGQHQAELANSQRQDDFLNLKHERDQEEYREGSVRTTHTSKSSVRTTHTSKSHSRAGSHVSQR